MSKFLVDNSSFSAPPPLLIIIAQSLTPKANNLGGSAVGMLPRRVFKFRVSEMPLPAISAGFSAH